MTINSDVRNFLEESKEILKNGDLFELFLYAREYFETPFDVILLARTLEQANIYCKDVQLNVFRYITSHAIEDWVDSSMPWVEFSMPVEKFAKTMAPIAACGLTVAEITEYLKDHADEIVGLKSEKKNGDVIISII